MACIPVWVGLIAWGLPLVGLIFPSDCFASLYTARMLETRLARVEDAELMAKVSEQKAAKSCAPRVSLGFMAVAVITD